MHSVFPMKPGATGWGTNLPVDFLDLDLLDLDLLATPWPRPWQQWFLRFCTRTGVYNGGWATSNTLDMAVYRSLMETVLIEGEIFKGSISNFRWCQIDPSPQHNGCHFWRLPVHAKDGSCTKPFQVMWEPHEVLWIGYPGYPRPHGFLCTVYFPIQVSVCEHAAWMCITLRKWLIIFQNPRRTQKIPYTLRDNTI